MCGHYGRKGNLSPAGPNEHVKWIDLYNTIKPNEYLAYLRLPVPDLVTMADDQLVASEALWWYALKAEEGKLVINEKVTSFNARNLENRLWKNAIRQRRGIVFATQIGESKGNERYLMEANEWFALGCVYKDWELNGKITRSFAVITRPPHERFSKYHDKSIPLFLPMDTDFLDEWLDPKIETSPIIQDVLDTPKLRVNFRVTPVRSYKSGEALGRSEKLESD